MDTPPWVQAAMLLWGLMFFPLLRNAAARLALCGHPVDVLGIRWARSEKAMVQDIAATAALRRPDAFPLLLAHHPHAFDAAARAGIPLTHGGQIMLKRMGREWLARKHSSFSRHVPGPPGGSVPALTLRVGHFSQLDAHARKAAPFHDKIFSATVACNLSGRKLPGGLPGGGPSPPPTPAVLKEFQGYYQKMRDAFKQLASFQELAFPILAALWMTSGPPSSSGTTTSLER